MPKPKPDQPEQAERIVADLATQESGVSDWQGPAGPVVGESGPELVDLGPGAHITGGR